MTSRLLADRLSRGEAVVAGVLSGTSADGIDVALSRFAAPGGTLALEETLAFAIEPFPPALARRLRALLDGAAPSLRELALLQRDLGTAFGRAARNLAERTGLDLDLVGSHGQTVWHHDGAERSGPATLQLGDGDFVAESAGCAVVSDFRQRDVAAGGEGAPLSAYGDDLLFARAPRPLCLLNLGGMGNLSWLDEECVLALDTGPAGSLLDGLARRLLDRPFDPGGAHAARGRPDAAFVRAVLDHPFFERPPPRSTGRDSFGERWLDGLLAEALGRTSEDLLASAVEAVAQSVAQAIERHLPAAPAPLVVAGGGVHNRTLMDALARCTPAAVVTSATLGVDPDAREALVFAGLAVRHVLGIGVTRPEATGARTGRVLGKLSPFP